MFVVGSLHKVVQLQDICLPSPSLNKRFNNLNQLNSDSEKHKLRFKKGGERHNAVVQCKGHSRWCISVNRELHLPKGKIQVKKMYPVGTFSVFTLKRTDTTLDLSQTAEKVRPTTPPPLHH